MATTAQNQNNVYEGERNEKGEKHGYGTLRFNNKAHYVGYWVNDKMEGKGEYVWGDGHKYVGEFKNNKQEGLGIYQWPTGGKYVGNWKADRMNGFGTYTRNDGVIYIGVWKEDHQFGMGMKIIPERFKYGEDGKMYRRRKYREVWNADRVLVYHKEIKEYPDLWNVWERSKFTDLVILTVRQDNIPYEEEKKQMYVTVDEKSKPSIPSLSVE